MRMIDILPNQMREWRRAPLPAEKRVLSVVFTTALNDQVTVLYPKAVKPPIVPTKPLPVEHRRPGIRRPWSTEMVTVVLVSPTVRSHQPRWPRSNPHPTTGQVILRYGRETRHYHIREVDAHETAPVLKRYVDVVGKTPGHTSRRPGTPP